MEVLLSWLGEVYDDWRERGSAVGENCYFEVLVIGGLFGLGWRRTLVGCVSLMVMKKYVVRGKRMGGMWMRVQEFQLLVPKLLNSSECVKVAKNEY